MLKGQTKKYIYTCIKESKNEVQLESFLFVAIWWRFIDTDTHINNIFIGV